MHTQIIELNDRDLAELAGGFWQVVVGIAIGVAANYIYDSVGGKDGIDAAVSGALDAATDADHQAAEYMLNMPVGVQ